MSVSTLIRHFGCIGLVCVGAQAGANDTVETRLMTLPLASDIATAKYTVAFLTAQYVTDLSWGTV